MKEKRAARTGPSNVKRFRKPIGMRGTRERIFFNKRSRMTANSFDAVIVEDLNMKGLAQSLNLGKSTTDNAWGMFLLMLAYKLADQGKRLAKAGRFFPSGKTCSCCGKLHDMPLAKRVCERECGLVTDRDHNAAINIRNVGLRLLRTNRGTPGVSLST